MKFLSFKKISLVLIFLFLFSCSLIQVYAQTFSEVRNQTRDHSQQIDLLRRENSDLRENYKLLYDAAKNQNDQLSNQISFASYLLGLFSFILTIIGILLAVYISRLHEKIIRMKKEIEDTKEYIDGHNDDLYEKIKRGQTVSLLNRLTEVPEDVLNVGTLLFSTELLEEDFLPLKHAYSKLDFGFQQKEAQNYYITLFMQHFAYCSLKDATLKPVFISNINTQAMDAMFRKDIQIFFKGTFKYLSEVGIETEENKSLIKMVFYCFSKAKLGSDNELQKFIKGVVRSVGLNQPDVRVIAMGEFAEDLVYSNWLNQVF